MRSIRDKTGQVGRMQSVPALESNGKMLKDFKKTMDITELGFCKKYAVF